MLKKDDMSQQVVYFQVCRIGVFVLVMRQSQVNFLGWHRSIHGSGDCDTVLGKRAKEDRRPCDGCVVRVDDLRALGTFTTIFFLQGDMNF